jgi:hypothetical protein
VKLELYVRMIARREMGPLYLPQDSSPDLLAGLSGQVLQKTRSGKREWKKIPGDHYGDCVKLARVSWWFKRGDFEQITE